MSQKRFETKVKMVREGNTGGKFHKGGNLLKFQSKIEQTSIENHCVTWKMVRRMREIDTRTGRHISSPS